MLISTSRKPSQKTRTFCKNFSHAFGYDYTNRGKSSLRDLLIKAKQLGHDRLVLVYQIKGNPSKLTFYDLEANEKLELLVSVIHAPFPTARRRPGSRRLPSCSILPHEAAFVFLRPKAFRPIL